MRSLRIPSLFGLAVLFVLLLAACGSSTDTGSATSSYSSSSSTPAASQAQPTTAPATPAPASSYSNANSNSNAASSGGAMVKTATATVGGKSVTILTNDKGITLYYFVPDTKTSSACTGGCADNWPPLVTTGSGTPTSTTALPGKLTVEKSANGSQVQYNGHFLYTFVGDQAAGDTKGEGVGGKWHVATTDLSALQ